MTFTEQHAEAVVSRDAARARMDRIQGWNEAKRDAAEDYEFWSNKVAYLDAAIEHERTET